MDYNCVLVYRPSIFCKSQTCCFSTTAIYAYNLFFAVSYDLLLLSFEFS